MAGALGCRQERPTLTNSLSPGLTNAIGSLGDLGPEEPELQLNR